MAVTLVEALQQDAAVAPGGNDQCSKATTLADTDDLILIVGFQRATNGGLGTSRSTLTFNAFTALSGFSGANGSLLVAGAWQPNSTQTTVTINGGTGSVNNTIGLIVLVYRGVDRSTPLDVAGGLTTFAAPSTPFDVTIPTFNTATNNALAVGVWASHDDQGWTPQSSGWSEVQDLESALGSDISISVATKTITTAGATGAILNRQTSGTGVLGRYAYLALKAAGGAVSGTVDVQLGGATVTAIGTPDVAGAVSVALGGATVTVVGAPGRPDVVGTTVVNLGGITATVAGTPDVAGVVAVNLGTIAVTVVGEGAGLAVELDSRRPDVNLEAKRPDVDHGPRRPSPILSSRRQSRKT